MARLTRLAQIDLKPDELEACTNYLEKMIAYLEILDEPELEGVAPTIYGLEPPPQRLRDDQPAESLPQEVVLAQAPVRTATEFKVPKIVE